MSVAAGGEFALDMATSQVCFGEVKHRRAQRRPLDRGWVTDAGGRPTTKPDEAYALSPLGGYKGQGLAMAVTLLAGVLTGAPLDWQLYQVGDLLFYDPPRLAGTAGATRHRPQRR
jgi:LDH2 family malate/lactate/ureidoglycolate dehydrogenase